MTLDRACIERLIDWLLDRCPDVEFRVVGTASSALRGIGLPVGDIDVLLRERAGLDRWFEAVAPEAVVLTPPTWLVDRNQYFAAVAIEGFTVELSTVEIDVGVDTAECAGVGPWRHFDHLDVGGRPVPLVSSELRLVTEVARMRPDRFQPIIEFLRARGCDVPLLRRGLRDAGVGELLATQVLDTIAPEAVRRHR